MRYKTSWGLNRAFQGGMKGVWWLATTDIKNKRQRKIRKSRQSKTSEDAALQSLRKTEWLAGSFEMTGKQLGMMERIHSLK